MKTKLSARLAVVALLTFLVTSGHSTLAAPSGGSAVIDLDKVATAMGWMDEMGKSIQATNTELKSQLEEVHRGMLQSVDGVKKQIATEAKLTEEQIKLFNNAKEQRELDALPLSKDQRQKLVEAVNKANAVWQQALNNYPQALQGHRASLVQSYREKIRPAARRVAVARGLSVVQVTSDNLIYFDPQSGDITDQVIDELQKSLPEKHPASATAPAASSGGK